MVWINRTSVETDKWKIWTVHFKGAK